VAAHAQKGIEAEGTAGNQPTGGGIEWQTAEASEVAKVAGRKIIDAALEIILEVAWRDRFRQR